MRTRSSLSATLVALALVLAACGGGGDDAASDTDAATDAAGDAADDGDAPADDGGASADAPAEGTTVAVASTSLGEVLVDAEGMTLYLFTPDPEGESTCEDDCAAAWPPLVVDGEPTAGDGLDPTLLGTLQRSDGSTQVSYGGAPLYTWASDREPGDVTGQGVGDVWFVVGPDGEPVTEAGGDAAGGDAAGGDAAGGDDAASDDAAGGDAAGGDAAGGEDVDELGY